MNKVDGTSGSSFEKDLAFYESDEGSFRDGYIGKYLAIIDKSFVDSDSEFSPLAGW